MNPYALTFGKIPEQMIERVKQRDEILNSFLEKNPSRQACIITGVRGCGKTVFMTEITQKLSKHPDWIALELNPERNLLEGLAAKMSSRPSLAGIFRNAHINLSVLGFGVEISGTTPVTDIEYALTKMLESLKNHNKKILIAIDEISNNKNTREFIHAFQIFLRQDLPVFLLATGLYDNVYELQNEKSLTFLYRAPKIELNPLNINSIADNYCKNLKVSIEEARKLANLTMGYSFAFQVLGFLYFNNKGKMDVVLPEYRQYLEEYVYEKIWTELSSTDKKVLIAIQKSESKSIAEIREIIGYETNQFNPYRMRLIRKGLVNGDTHGYLSFTLPLFDEFIKSNI